MTGRAERRGAGRRPRSRRAAGRSGVQLGVEFRVGQRDDALGLALVSVHTIEERLPLSGRIANGPAGRKCSSARPSWSRSCATVVTMPTGRSPSPASRCRRLADCRARAVGGDQEPRRDHRRRQARRTSIRSAPGLEARHRGGRRSSTPSAVARSTSASISAGSRPCGRTARPARPRRRRSGTSAAPRPRAWNR